MLLLASISALCLCRINDLHVYSMQCNVDIRIYIYMSCKCCQHLVHVPTDSIHWIPRKLQSLLILSSGTCRQRVFLIFRSQCHCPWICLFGHFYSRSRGKEQIAALLALVCHAFESFLRQDCLESMTNYVIRSAGRSPVWATSHIKGLAKNMVLLQMSEMFFV